MLPRAIETTGVDEAVESETIIKSNVGLINTEKLHPKGFTAKGLVKESSDSEVDRANEGKTTDDDLANDIEKATPMPKGDNEDDENDYAETMEPKHAVTESRRGEETPMPDGMTPGAGSKLGATDDDDDEDDKNDYAETMEPKQAVTESRRGEETPMPKGRSSDVPSGEGEDEGEGEETEMPQDGEVTEEGEESGVPIVLPAYITVQPHKMAAGSHPTLLPLAALESSTQK